YKSYTLQKPNEYQGWRELGAAYYHYGDFDDALSALQTAEKIKGDARTRLYLGMTYEKMKQWDDASQAYNSALSMSPSPDVASRVTGRLEILSSRKEIERALAAEASLSADSIPANTIAVYDFDGTTLDSQLAPLALGLAEFTAIDLSKVKKLTVVERAKLNFLLKEMELAASGVIDTSRAPQVGRILGSRNIVTGRVTSPNLEHLRLSGQIINTLDSSEKSAGSSEAILREIFKMQKDFVRQIVQELGIELTPEEMDSLNILPTDSYAAFLAFCQGLAYQKNGQYDRALEEFRRALHLDKNFVYAGLQMGITSNLFNQSNFENYVQTGTIGGLSGLENTLGNVLENTGAIPNPSGGNNETISTNPPHVPTGAVRVKGKVDGN
ncbi:MAG: tetratricopeptide repeat protein, partial [Candidatus Zixiibacteriota bacterium]